jgi:hypothetical protein
MMQDGPQSQQDDEGQFNVHMIVALITQTVLCARNPVSRPPNDSDCDDSDDSEETLRPSSSDEFDDEPDEDLEDDNDGEDLDLNL